MLVFGGRYGTIEPGSQKSYIHVEYEYAVSLDKPHFAVIMDDAYLKEKVRIHTTDALEQLNPQLHREFKDQVTSKMCRMFNSIGDLKLAVFESLREIERTRELVGWVRANELSDPAPLIEEIKQLRADNTRMQNEITNLHAQLPSEESYNGYSFSEVVENLERTWIKVSKEEMQSLKIFMPNASALSIFWQFRKILSFGVPAESALGMWLFKSALPELSSYGLVERVQTHAQTTALGHSFIRQMEREGKDRTVVRLCFDT